jgi:hypothetical protein
VASVKGIAGDVPKWSLDAANLLASESGRREEIPLRRAFVRTDESDEMPPLAQLVSAGGRGGAVPLKLYLALVWRCSAEPFETDILARQWATLLGLEEPNTLGARRVTRALDVLAGLKLVALQKRRGESTIVTLLEESGSNAAYTLPSTAYTRAPSAEAAARHRYFKIPLELWTKGHIQSMSTAGIAMLLVLLAERNVDGRRTWWSTERFPQLFNLSPTIRSQGTSELQARSLVHVRKESVTNSPSPTFRRERVRNTYKLIGDARPAAMVAAETKKRAERAKNSSKSKPKKIVTRAGTLTATKPTAKPAKKAMP